MRDAPIATLLKRSLAALLLLAAVGLAKLPVSSDVVPWAWLLSLGLALPFLVHRSLRPLYGGWGLSVFALILLIAVGQTPTILAWQVIVFALALLATVLPSEGLVGRWRPGTLISAAAGAAQLLPRSDVNVLPLGSDFDLALLIVGSAALLSRYLNVSSFSFVKRSAWAITEPFIPLLIAWAIGSWFLLHGTEALPWLIGHLFYLHALPSITAIVLSLILRPARRAVSLLGDE